MFPMRQGLSTRVRAQVGVHLTNSVTMSPISVLIIILLYNNWGIKVHTCFQLFIYYYYYFFVCGIFRAAPTAYGISQARDWIRGSCWPTPQKCGIHAISATYATAQGNAGSLTHWARPGIKPMSSWILVGFELSHDGNSSNYLLIN